jgi:sialic acid synthase SpsE/quercetin dioxygenase-like cupin family protein
MDRPLFIFEMANNHNGDVDHGRKIISAVKKMCVHTEFDYAFKLQYRRLDSFIHKNHRAESNDKSVKRFMGTKLSLEQFETLKNEIEEQGFITICTPFDEKSVELVEEHGFKYIKIASCSFTDWPLWEKVALCDKPIIASTAGAELDEIDRVVQFLTNRKKVFSLMHCVGEYPTGDSNLQLNQIDLLKCRYGDVRIGYSAHEHPDNLRGIMLAIAKGASIFEKHVGMETEAISLNAYSLSPNQVRKWLDSAKEAYEMCGIEGTRYEISEKERSDLWNFKRGVFAGACIKKGDFLNAKNTYYAIPKIEGQITANDMSKYVNMEALIDISPDAEICFKSVKMDDAREVVRKALSTVRDILSAASVAISQDGLLELSHHYGAEHFAATGVAIIECINNSKYCKKILVLLPGQAHPTHFHKKKEESFQVLYGDVTFTIEGVSKTYAPGEIVHALPGQRHSFSSVNGAVFEEVSTTHYVEDSFYDDAWINNNKARKTRLDFWKP